MFTFGIPVNCLEGLREKLETGWRANGYCWEWNGARNSGGYGLFKGFLVHRLAYAVFKHDFQKNYFVCHNCDNPICYNPSHLYLGDSKTNGLDAAQRRRIKSNSIYAASVGERATLPNFKSRLR